MTRSEEESLYLSLLSQLQSPEPALVRAALVSIKHQVIGHDQTKEVFVRLGIVDALVSILNSELSTRDKVWQDVKVEAGIVVGSLAYGGESLILHLLRSAALSPLTASLNPDRASPKLVQSSLRTLNTMLDTYISPSAPLNPAVAISAALYTPECLQNLCEILSQERADRQEQISLAASLIAKSCGRVPHISGGEAEETAMQREGMHQKLLVGAGVLDVLATRLAAFAPDEYRRNCSEDTKLPAPAPPNARIAPILDAIAAIIRGSKLRSLEFLFSPTLAALFPTDDSKASSDASLHLPQSSDMLQRPQNITTPSAFPPLSSAVSFTLDDDERLRSGLTSETDPALEIPELEIISWLVALIRSGDPITRLSAASTLTNLFLVGLVSKRLVSYVALLVVPILVHLLDGEGKIVGYGNTGVGGIDSQTWNRWQVEERAPAVLARLVIENLEFQKAAMDAGAVKKLAAILKKVSEPSSSAANEANGHTTVDQSTQRSGPEYHHRMKVKEGVLRCLANLGLFKDDYRKKIIDAGVLKTVVGSCMKPLTPISVPQLAETNSSSNGECNPPSVLIAACGVIRSVSRSVSILRTSLIDAAVAIPIFTLLRHENDDVKIAATAAVCNLVLDFSPMRKPITEAGALDVLCDLIKGSNGPLKLNAMWAIKHLMMEADITTKRRSLEKLGVEYFMSIISTVTPLEEDEDEDEEMPDEPAMQHEERLPPRIRSAVKHLQKQERVSQAARSRKEATALQEQGLEFVRNLICGAEVDNMIDHVFECIGADRLLSLYEKLLTTPNQPSEIVSAVVYGIVHIAAGAPRHRQRIIERTELLRVLLGFWNHHNANVRSGLAWVVINLTWKEEGSEAEGVQSRINVLKGLGWAERLRDMQKDPALDVKERVKTAEFQLGNGSVSSAGSSTAGSSR
ncbi:armadillo-type protein [Sphaerosporella brunnea]|uniref:Armadillo-type protein n=1 Tax=Sphaerosporella brunnea TaxID=1250544 RepID=A0A5J5EHC8_9PEZI|nr:armadillo-type protein [Sphaerosporella brunnea]